MDNQKVLRLLRYVLAGITFICICLILLSPIGQSDFFWHLTTGRWIVEHHSLPKSDPFNYTTPSLSSPREHFILTSYWLSQISYYGIYYISGWSGFILSRFIILGLIIYFVYKRAKGSDKTILFSMIALTLVMFVQMYTFERPQVFSFIFFAILLYLLEYLREACSEQRVADKEAASSEQRVACKEKQTTSYTLHPKRYTLFFAPYTLYAKRYAMLPLLMLFWANMHGGYILGQGVIFVYLLAEGLKFLHPSLNPMGKSSYKRFLITGISGILSALINPNTYHAIIEIWSVSKYSPMIRIVEHVSTITFFKAFYTYYIPVYWLLLLITAVSLLYRIVKKRFDIQDAVMLIGLGYFSFTQLRYVAFFLIWATPFIALSLTRMMQGFEITSEPALSDKTGLLRSARNDKRGGASNEKTLRSLGLRYICILLSMFITVALITKHGGLGMLNIKNISKFKTGQWVNNDYPEDAVRFIKKNNIKGNMFNHYDWGGYLIWRFYPEKKVFIDGRNLYEFLYFQWDSIINATIEPKILGMPYYKALLESYRVRYMVIPLFSLAGEMLPLVGEMIKDKEWVPVFFKDNTMVFVKDTPENYNVIHRYSIPEGKFIADLFKMINDKIKESPRDFRLYITKGDLYYSQWKFTKAREEYEKVLKINPFNETARKRLGILNNYSR